MKIIDLEQGSAEWLAWRRTVITATDASILMGHNAWETPYSCWQRKLGLIPEKKSNEAMERGKRLEPEARAQFIARQGIAMHPAVVESTEFDFLGASLDGISEKGNYILEIKCGGEKLHEMAKNGEIPEYYRDQMQHQLLVTGAKLCFYYSYDGTDGVYLEVLPDPKFREEFLPKAREFFKCIALNESPPLQSKDYRDMSHVVKWHEFSDGYNNICEEIDRLEEKKEVFRKGLIELGEDQNCMGNGIYLSKIQRKGNVDYSCIPALKEIDLEAFRKEPTTSWRILRK